ncbi:MAG: hypothetical protein PHX93_02980 [Candidatus Peribacteraceae bacterium]|jgi:hypothetical protein|nr:hypothetical protein [Candidatus Peribacteraceae bacterium]
MTHLDQSSAHQEQHETDATFEQSANPLSAAQAERLVHAVQAHHGQHVAQLVQKELSSGKPLLRAVASALSESGIVRDGPSESDDTRFNSLFRSRYRRA